MADIEFRIDGMIFVVHVRNVRTYICVQLADESRTGVVTVYRMVHWELDTRRNFGHDKTWLDESIVHLNTLSAISNHA